MLYFTDQGAAAVKAAVAPVYADITHQSPYVPALANQLNQQFTLGYRAELCALLDHADPTVAFTAARALEQVGTLLDADYMEVRLAAITSALPKDAKVKGAYPVFFGSSIEALRARLEPVTLPPYTPARTVLTANTDLSRFLPLDGNNVFNGKGLLRRWPKGGPKELWRLAVGQGKSAVVEAGGKAYTLAEADGKVFALCLDATNGGIVWKRDVHGSPNGGMGPVAGTIVDGERLYLSPGQVNTPLVCLSTKDGAEIWRSAAGIGIANCSSPLLADDTVLWKKEGKDWSSDQQLIVADGLLFATTTGGELVMAEANRRGYKELGRVALNADLGERQQPTLANGRLYVRANRWVICYQVSAKVLGRTGETGKVMQ